MIRVVMLLFPVLLSLSAVSGEECPREVVHVEGTCYIIKYSSSKRWTQALGVCAGSYRQMAKPPTQDVNNAIKERLMDFNPECKRDNAHRYWLAIRRTATLEFFHFDNTTIAVPYVDWNPYKETPVDEFGQYNCVMYECANNTHWWTTDSCSRYIQSICEMTECPEQCIPETTTTASTTIEDGATATTTDLSTTADTTTVTDEINTASEQGDGDENFIPGVNNKADEQNTLPESGGTTATSGKAASVVTILTTLRFPLTKMSA